MKYKTTEVKRALRHIVSLQADGLNAGKEAAKHLRDLQGLQTERLKFMKEYRASHRMNWPEKWAVLFAQDYNVQKLQAKAYYKGIRKRIRFWKVVKDLWANMTYAITIMNHRDFKKNWHSSVVSPKDYFPVGVGSIDAPQYWLHNAVVDGCGFTFFISGKRYNNGDACLGDL